MGANLQVIRNCQDFCIKMKICGIKFGLLTSLSFRVNMYKIEDWFELDLKRNLLCQCSKWSTVSHLDNFVLILKNLNQNKIYYTMFNKVKQICTSLNRSDSVWMKLKLLDKFNFFPTEHSIF